MTVWDPQNLPVHVAIIMDGNGRWASSRNLPRVRGHLEGVRRVEEIAIAGNAMGIKVMTLYTFSTENWRRPPGEVSMLMKTMSTVLDHKMNTLVKNNIRFRCIGHREGVPQEVLQSIDRGVEMTMNCTGMILNMAFNYGGRTEILDAVRSLCGQAKRGQLDPEAITEARFSGELYTRDLPDPDLLIRTSGEKRISNFLLWQLSYAEFYFTDKYWPEFDKAELEKAVREFQKRDRRYGRVNGAEATSV